MKRIMYLSLILFVAAPIVFAQTARKTVTNADLDKFREARLKAEAEYRANYKKLGMPSPEELEKQEAERQAYLREFSRQADQEREYSEQSFASRANALRSELAAVNAQINYLRGELGRIPNNQTFYSVGYPLYGSFQRGHLNGRGYGRQMPYENLNGARPTAVIAPRAARGTSVVVNAGSANPNYGYGVGGFGRFDGRWYGSINLGYGAANYYGYPYYYGGYALPLQNDANQLERTELVSLIRELEERKAGLLAVWNELREEARRAGVNLQ